MDLGELKGEEVVNGDYEVARFDQGQVVVWKMDQPELSAEQAQRQQRLFRQAVGSGVDRQQVRGSTDQGTHDRGILSIGHHGEAFTEDRGELRKQPANIATNA